MTSRGSQRLSLSQSGLTGEAVNLGSRRFRSDTPLPCSPHAEEQILWACASLQSS